jgi:hypothetical protein
MLPPPQSQSLPKSCLPAGRAWRLGFAAAAALIGMVASNVAQPVVPPAAVAQFQQVIGSRVEAVTILGGDYAAAGGVYAFRGGNLADLSVSKLGGGGIVAAPRSLGGSEIKWAPVLQGNLGHSIAENEFTSGYLQGNRTRYELLAVQFGGGARFYFTDHFSLTPTLSGIYGHTENEFLPVNPVGDAIKVAASGTFVDWELETWSAVPALDLRYDYFWGRTTLAFSSRYNFFHTENFDSSSPVVAVDGNSHTWENKLDVDVPLGVKLFQRELHTGGFLSRTEVFGGAADGLNEDHVYTVNGRLVLDLLGKVWKVRWIGFGYSYFWGDNFDGWSAGVSVRLQF